MKTLLKLTILSLIILLSPIKQNVHAQKNQTIKLSKIQDFNRIVIDGNVEVRLVTRPTVGIHYDEANEGHAIVTQSGRRLNILASNRDIRTKIVLYVNEMYRIEAGSNCMVTTDSKLNLKYLQIYVKENAVVDMDISTLHLYTVVADKSSLTLRGKSNYHTLISEGTPRLRFRDFVIEQSHMDLKSEGNLLSNSVK